MSVPLTNMYQLEILRDDDRVQSILTSEEAAHRELDAWVAFEQARADTIAEQIQARQQDPLGLAGEQEVGTFVPQAMHVRRVEGLTLDGRFPAVIAYRFCDVSGVQLSRVA